MTDPPTNEEAPPPSYEEAQSDAPSGTGVVPSNNAVVPQGDSAVVSSEPPLDAHRAEAPLVIHRTNGAISGNYAVSISDNKAAPDVHFKSTNGSITPVIYLQGSVPRPAGVQIEGTNGALRFAITRTAGQAIDVTANTTNGAIAFSIPLDFRGMVSVRSQVGSIRLSPQVQQHAVIVPSSDSKTTLYRIARPDSAQGIDTKGRDSKDNKDPEFDNATLRTTNGSVRLNYFGENKDETPSGGQSSCVIA